MQVKLIVGLGNPGIQYENTRHNAGFIAIDKICQKLDVKLDKNCFNGNYGILKTENANIIIAKPLTFMNLSGEFVTAIAKFFKIDIQNILIIYDDMDTVVGKFRIRANGSSGGQNGIKNIINLFNNQNIARIRIGIGKSPVFKKANEWVLGEFSNQERKLIDEVTNQIVDAVICFFDHPIDYVMNKFNKK